MAHDWLGPDDVTWPVIRGSRHVFAGPALLAPVSPVDGQSLTRVAVAPPGVVAIACQAVSSGWAAGREHLAAVGPTVAARIAALLHERADEGADLITREMGKLRDPDSRAEVLKAADFFDWAALRMDREGSVQVDRDGRRLASIRLRSAGVVGIISPWNFPVSIPSEYLAAAVASGSGVVWKPSEQVPETSLWLLEIILEAGFPPEAIALVTGPGLPTGDAVFASGEVDCLCFTGSTQAGAQLARHVGLRRRIFELGGNCPALVIDPADIGQVAAELAWGGISGRAGQRCNSVERVIVTSARVAAGLAEAIEQELRAVRVGSPWDAATTLGPLATAAAASRVRNALAEAERQGATVLAAGEAGLGDCFVPPALVTGVSTAMELFRAETFGPVIAITETAGLAAAIDAANSTGYGLYGAVFSADEQVLRRCAAEVNVSVLVQNGAPGRWDASLPVGGAARSTSGVGRVGGAYALGEITETRCTQF